MAAPVLATATIGTDGVTLTLTWGVTVTPGAASPVISIGARLATITGTYSSGTGTSSLVYALATTVYQGETCTVNTPADTAESLGSTPNNALAGHSLTNSSTQQSLMGSPLGKAVRMMRNRCMVLRKTESQSSASAGRVVSWPVVYTGVPCSIQNKSTSKDFAEAVTNPKWTWRGYFPANLGIEDGDRVCNVTGHGMQSLASKILEVRGNPADHAGLGAYAYVDMEEVKGVGA